jgi:Na+/H+ antiporter NhaD/arsenite permease-like protein
MYVLMAVVFIFGYMMIALEHVIKIDKAASAILTATLVWSILVLGVDDTAGHEIRHHLGEISEILFFLLGAMTIVELIDAHEGFKIITDHITSRNKVRLLWALGFITFFLSAVLDNLTTTIVMVSLLRRLVSDQRERWFFAGIVVIAANAGGAWTPIGDVTTTMLWIGTQITTISIVSQLLVPSLVCLAVPLVVLSFRLRGDVQTDEDANHDHIGAETVTTFERNLVFIAGIGALLFVPVFKSVTHLPPYMGILFGLSVLWVITEIMHGSKNDEVRRPLSISGVIHRVDTTSVLFFLGILLAVSALATAGHLTQVASFLEVHLGNVYTINIAIGFLSALVDNVPLVAGAMKMYPLVTPEVLAAAAPDQSAWLSQFVVDGRFWAMLAYCAGTGGSCLIIGSAAGVAAMGMEKIDFFWYLKNVSWLALLGYLGGALTYIAMAGI